MFIRNVPGHIMHQRVDKVLIGCLEYNARWERSLEPGSHDTLTLLRSFRLLNNFVSFLHCSYIVRTVL